MSSLTKKIELGANLAIILVAILLGIVLARNYLYPQSRAPQDTARLSIQTGTKLSVPGVDWKANGRTLVMVLSTQCHFCTESAPFYKQLAQQRAANVRLVAAFPQAITDGQKYLSGLGVTADDVKQVQLETLGVNATPIVTQSWLGKLPTEKEAEVINRLR